MVIMLRKGVRRAIPRPAQMRTFTLGSRSACSIQKRTSQSILNVNGFNFLGLDRKLQQGDTESE